MPRESMGRRWGAWPIGIITILIAASIARLSTKAAAPPTPSHQRSWFRRAVVTEIVLAGLLGTALFVSQYAIDSRRADREVAREERLVLVQTLNSTRLLDGADFAEADLSGLTLLGKSLQQANLRNVALEGTTLSGSFMFRADLSNAEISDSLLGCAPIADATATQLTADRVPIDTVFCVDLTRASLRAASIEGSDLRSIELSGADLSEVVVRRSDLRNARMLCIPSGAEPGCPVLEGAIFDEVDLRGVEFGRAVDLSAVSFQDVCWDSSTLWPMDFDQPRATCG